MSDVFLKLLNMSITASWLVVSVIILRLLFKKAPKWINCLLWAMVGIRLVMPFSLESVLSLIPSSQPIPENIAVQTNPAVDTGIPVLNNAINPIINQSLAPNMGDSANPLQIIIAIASLIWIIGIVIMLLYSIISYLCIRHKVKISLNYRENIYYCDNISSPFILGVIRPKIYIPSGLDQSQTEYVISHEKAHLKRLDHFWKPFAFLILSFYWFNPIIWIAYILLCRDIELACDERVIKNMDVQYKMEYSKALADCAAQRRMIMACPLAFGEIGVKERVKTVLNYKKPAFWIILVAVIAVIATAVCFLTNPPEDDITDNSDITDGNKNDSSVSRINYGYVKDNILAVDINGVTWYYQCRDERIYDYSQEKLLSSFQQEEDGEIVNWTLYSIKDIPNNYRVLLLSDKGNSYVCVKLEGYQPNTMTVNDLRIKYPEYFNLPTDKGLKLFVTMSGRSIQGCRLSSGDNDNYSSLPEATLGEMQMILSQKYNIHKPDVTVYFLSAPSSSYTVDINYTLYDQSTLRSVFGLYSCEINYGSSAEQSFLNITYNTISEIRDETPKSDMPQSVAPELFYEDSKGTYHLSSSRSRYIKVIFKDGTEISLADALLGGYIPVIALKAWDIEYTCWERQEGLEHFTATIVEVKGKSILVKPFDDEWESYCKVFELPKETNNTDIYSTFSVGDVIEVEYKGYILETDPAQLTETIAIYFLK